MDINACDNAQSALTHSAAAAVAENRETQKNHILVGAAYAGRLLPDAIRWFITRLTGDPGSAHGPSGFDR